MANSARSFPNGTRRRLTAAALAAVVGACLWCGRAGEARAGVFVFAEDLRQADIITHPIGYTGSGGELEIRVGIDPASPYAAQMAVPLQNVINVFNSLTPTTGNLLAGADNDVPANAFDFESVALHEMGHALGLGHPNLANESGLSGGSADYTKSSRGKNGVYNLNPGPDGVIGSGDDVRGDDVNLHWFSRLDNDPFTLDTTVDAATYSRDLADLPPGDSFAASANRDVGELLGYAATEAVMKQGTYNDEAQRTLGADDVATLRLACAGLDETEGTADDYTFRLVYAGLTTDADIVIAFGGGTSFAFTEMTGVFLGDTHVAVTSADMYFSPAVNWFFNTVPADNVRPRIDGQVPDPLRTPMATPLAITLDHLRVTDPDNAYPADFTLAVADGSNYTRDGSTITPAAGFSGRLRVAVTVSDGNAASDSFDLAVSVYDLVYVEPGGACGGSSPCYATLQAGIDDVAARAAGVAVDIRVAGAAYAEAPDFDAEAEITLDAGWSVDFGARTGAAASVDPGAGALTFSRGQTAVRGLVVE